ncbi:MAG: hypothetical protein LQ340_001540 [Diploschistes diacapsis]|nr:MAG: hypothetical protein LQ340_001540 [Diploschistes diacapsis]
MSDRGSRWRQPATGLSMSVEKSVRTETENGRCPFYDKKKKFSSGHSEKSSLEEPCPKRTMPNLEFPNQDLPLSQGSPQGLPPTSPISIGSSNANRNTSPEKIWYFAYGSNLSAAKFTGSRGIVPLARANVRLPAYKLALNVPGLPYSEPTFMGIEPLNQQHRFSNHQSEANPSSNSNSGSCPGSSVDEKLALLSSLEEGPAPTPDPAVTGVAYLITAAQYTHVFASEGGGIVYADAFATACPVSPADEAIIGGTTITVRTLGVVASVQRHPHPRASARYMDICLSGAVEAGLPLAYRRYLASFSAYVPPEEGTRARAGALVFLALWGPVMGAAERLTKRTMREDGYAPFHDWVFGPVFGRGDGVGGEESERVMEREVGENDGKEKWVEGEKGRRRTAARGSRGVRRIKNYGTVWYGV